jgi:hypothetical protein
MRLKASRIAQVLQLETRQTGNPEALSKVGSGTKALLPCNLNCLEEVVAARMEIPPLEQPAIRPSTTRSPSEVQRTVTSHRECFRLHSLVSLSPYNSGRTATLSHSLLSSSVPTPLSQFFSDHTSFLHPIFESSVITSPSIVHPR